MIKQLFQLTKGILGFVIIWAILVFLSPFFIAILCGQYAKELLTVKKVDKLVDAPKVLTYIPATKDNDKFSCN